jgi:hypothetical protein
MNRFHPLLAAGVSIFAAVATSGCSAQAESRKSGRALTVFLDLSASITDGQRALWKREAARLVGGLGDDSSITVYAIHDHTMDAARLYEAEIPAPVADGTRAAAEKQMVARREARRGALAVIASALDSGGKASHTDVFSAIDRVRPAHDGRRLEVFFFSDMLNSTADFNMEVPGTLTRSAIPDRIGLLARKHSWRSGQLAGAEVYCVLNSIETGRRGPVVDRLTQQAFYSSLFESLGAHLMAYDTNISSLRSPAVEGGRYVARAE